MENIETVLEQDLHETLNQYQSQEARLHDIESIARDLRTYVQQGQTITLELLERLAESKELNPVEISSTTPVDQPCLEREEPD